MAVNKVEPETFWVKPTPHSPNSALPVVVYRKALSDTSPENILTSIERNGWLKGGHWKTFKVPHFHSNTHECYGIVRGSSIYQLGKSPLDADVDEEGNVTGKTFFAQAGDIFVLPAGISHCSIESEGEYEYIGLYPEGDLVDGSRWDINWAKDTPEKTSQPCGNCVRMHTDCVYLPTPPRQRRSQSRRQREMLERLRKLEGMVAGMDVAGQGERPQALDQAHSASLSSSPPGNSNFGGSPSPSLEGIDAIGQLSESFGRLEVREGRSMWFSNGLMARFHAEVRNIPFLQLWECLITAVVQAGERRNMTVESCNDGDEPSSVFWRTDQQAFDPLIYLPPRRQLPWYWDKFVERVDPLFKILHVPTAAPSFLEFDAESSPITMWPLFFAICYCVVCSLRPDECAAELGDDRHVLILKYKTALQRALSTARFLATQELSVMQALVLLLSYVQGREAEELWTLSGLTIRIAQHMGLHREGEANGLLSPFTAEMRRRVWWQICVLDVQISEARGAESFLFDLFFDTRMPLHVRDADLDLDMTVLPEPRKGCTEMTWSLVMFEAFDIMHRIARMPPGKMHQKSVLIADFATRVEEQYLVANGTKPSPLLRSTRAMFHFLHSKLLLLLHRPFRAQPLSQDVKDTVFQVCLEALESWYSMATDTTVGGRSPGFRSNSLLQPLVLVLAQLCEGRKDKLAERAWPVVMAAQLPSRDGSLQPRMRRLIDPVQGLLDRARKTRELQLQRLCLGDPNSSSIGQEDHSLAGLVPSSNALDGAATQLPTDLAAWADELPGLCFPDDVMWLDFQGFAHPPS
ncbi:C6 transcription factor [Lasiodiplodia theobromae]|uniref:C6 transcription factor n=1 Tax=Lasiodiplodia theobromae TaxID=45133 RepID=UPI0015C39411|nr:C6 transcription factor [Lasiodiplodia theobromae]KAF4534988.1 C6 transcription factor [Lasiodiplodia theobromae]